MVPALNFLSDQPPFRRRFMEEKAWIVCRGTPSFFCNDGRDSVWRKPLQRPGGLKNMKNILAGRPVRVEPQGPAFAAAGGQIHRLWPNRKGNTDWPHLTSRIRLCKIACQQRSNSGLPTQTIPRLKQIPAQGQTFRRADLANRLCCRSLRWAQAILHSAPA